MFAARKTDSATAAGPATYIEDVFSTYLYTGNGANQSVGNGIQLGGLPTDGTILQLTGDTLTDSAPVPCAIVNNGVSVNTTTKKYGTGSLYIPTTGSDISAYSSDLNFGTRDFTIECWVYATSTSNQGVFQLGSDAWGGGCVFVSMYPANVFQWGWDGSYGGSGTFSTNTWIHIALVRQGNTLKFYVNGTQSGSTNTYSGNVSSGICKVGYYYAGGYSFSGGYIDDLRVSNKAVYTSNFTPPTAALPIDTLIAGSNYGGMVWLKGRSGATAHALYDTARGATFDLASNSTAAQTTETTGLTSFNSNGFSIGSLAKLNTNGTTYASWTFRKQAKFFDVVTWTGNGTGNRTIPHALGSTPGFIQTKRTNGVENWWNHHRSVTSPNANWWRNYASLNATNTFADWGDNSGLYQSPDANNLYIGSYYNASGNTYVAYLFAHNAGGFGATGADNVISCGSFTTDASGSFTAVNLGYEPQWLLFKRTDSSTAGGWTLLDNMRGFAQTGNRYLEAQSSAAESAGFQVCPLSTGFGDPNNSGPLSASATYIYIAIRRGPMKTPTSGTSVFAPDAAGNNASAGGLAFDAGFPVDWYVRGEKSGSNKFYGFSRLTGNEYLTTTSTAAGATTTYADQFDSMTGIETTTGFDFTGQCAWLFRRAPGVFDVVCYTGAGNNTTVSHNLGVVPELAIFKSRNTAGPDWVVRYPGTTTDRYMLLNTTGAEAVASGWYSATSSQISFPTSYLGTANSGYTYVAYLFASVTSVSKVGSYTGNGSSQTINCGFAAGARFVMIKRTDSTGDWYVWDTARGIVSGNDPRLSLNSTAAEVTTDDSIDPDNSGFIVNQLSATNINVSSATYIYLAIA